MLIGQVANAGACGSGDGWYFDNPVPPGVPPPTKITLCPGSCGPLQGTAGSQLDVLLGCMVEVARRDGAMRLGGISPEAATVLELTRLDQVFEMFPTAAEAVWNCSQLEEKVPADGVAAPRGITLGGREACERDHAAVSDRHARPALAHGVVRPFEQLRMNSEQRPIALVRQ